MTLKQMIKFKPVKLTENSKVILSLIPSDWEIIKLREITEPITKGTTPMTEGFNYVKKGINFFRVENINDSGNIDLNNCYYISEENHKYFGRSQLKENDILFSLAGTLGRVGRINKSMVPANINQALGIVRIKSSQYNHGFLAYLLRGHLLQKQINIEKTIMAQPNISLTQLANFKIVKPPLDVQQKIVSILLTVDELIQKTEEIIVQTQRLKNGLMQRLLTRGIGHIEFRRTRLGEIPIHWEVKEMREIGDLNAGGTPSRLVKEYWENGTIPWLSSGEIRNNIITSSKEKITKRGLDDSAARLFPKGTVLIAITGQGLTRGRTALLEIDSTTNQSVIGTVCKNSVINNIFLWYYLQNQYWNLRNMSQGSNQAGLNLNILNSYKILIPPLGEQKRIIAILSNIDLYIQNAKQSKSQFQSLKKGLMQKLLTGELRVKV